jgi:hypothetical protein
MGGCDAPSPKGGQALAEVQDGADQRDYTEKRMT